MHNGNAARFSGFQKSTNLLLENFTENFIIFRVIDSLLFISTKVS